MDVHRCMYLKDVATEAREWPDWRKEKGKQSEGRQVTVDGIVTIIERAKHK